MRRLAKLSHSPSGTRRSVAFCGYAGKIIAIVVISAVIMFMNAYALLKLNNMLQVDSTNVRNA